MDKKLITQSCSTNKHLIYPYDKHLLTRERTEKINWKEALFGKEPEFKPK